MRRYHFVVALAAMLTTACALTSPAKRDLGEVARTTVKVFNTLNGSGGSAVPVQCDEYEPGRWALMLLTCKHVIAGADLSTWTSTIANERHLGRPELVLEHPTLDLALLRVELTDGPLDCMPIRHDHPDVGEVVFAIGYPGCGRRVITRGYIGDRGCASADVFPGNSGGAVVDSDGRLVGIVAAVGVMRHGPFGPPTFIDHDMVFVPIVDALDWLGPFVDL